jgi:hypothetical protein
LPTVLCRWVSGRNATPFKPGDIVVGDLPEGGCTGFAEYVATGGKVLA